jgi:signal transduction histidine kinase
LPAFAAPPLACAPRISSRRPGPVRNRPRRSASGSIRRCAAPLAHIVENAERLRAQPEGPLRRDYTGYAADIASAGRHLLSLVDDLVDLQAIERPEFVPEAEALDLADLARRAAGLLSVRAADHRVRIDPPGTGEPLARDRRLHRAPCRC